MGFKEVFKCLTGNPLFPWQESSLVIVSFVESLKLWPDFAEVGNPGQINNAKANHDRVHQQYHFGSAGIHHRFGFCAAATPGDQPLQKNSMYFHRSQS